jgi:hypothetical protein
MSLALFVPSASASNIVELRSPGYLHARGVVAEVTVMVTCNGRAQTVGGYSTPTVAQLRVKLSERVRQHIASGAARATTYNDDFRCNGSSHLITLNVPAKSRPFVKGGGTYATATLTVCGFECKSATDAQIIRLH